MKVSLEKWLQMKFRITHQMCLLLEHSVGAIRSRKGVVSIGDSRLERVQQNQSQGNQISRRIPDRIKEQEMKLKREMFRNNKAFEKVT